MTEKKRPADQAEAAAATEDPARREALIKIGKYAAYTAPAMMVMVGSAQASPPVPISTPISTPPT